MDKDKEKDINNTNDTNTSANTDNVIYGELLNRIDKLYGQKFSQLVRLKLENLSTFTEMQIDELEFIMMDEIKRKIGYITNTGYIERTTDIDHYELEEELRSLKESLLFSVNRRKELIGKRCDELSEMISNCLDYNINIKPEDNLNNFSDKYEEIRDKFVSETPSLLKEAFSTKKRKLALLGKSRKRIKLRIILLFFIIALIFSNTFGICKVSGDSMQPTLADGQIVFFLKNNLLTKPFLSIDENDIVVVNIDKYNLPYRYLIKRVESKRHLTDLVKDTDYYTLTSDNKDIETLDSSYLGEIEDRSILGKVILKERD